MYAPSCAWLVCPRRYDHMMKKIIEKSPGCGFNFKTFRLKSLRTFSPKFARSDAVHRRGDRWTDGNRRTHSALRGNGYHDALGGRGARALRFDSTLRRRAGDATRTPTRATTATRARFAGGCPRPISRPGRRRWCPIPGQARPQVPSRLREARREGAVGPSRVAQANVGLCGSHGQGWRDGRPVRSGRRLHSFAGFEKFGGRDEAVPKGLGIYGLRFRVYWFMVYGFNYKNLLMIVFCGVVLSRAGRLFVPCLQGKARRAVRPPSG